MQTVVTIHPSTPTHHPDNASSDNLRTTMRIWGSTLAKLRHN